MTVHEITAQVVAANDARLEGQMTRAEHAVAIAQIYKVMAAHGVTWEQVEAQWGAQA
jgi:hypothetical protein